MKVKYLVVLSLLALLSCQKEETPIDHKMNSTTTTEQVETLLSKMTLSEKIGQLNQYSVGEEMTGPEAKKGENKARYEKLLNGEVGSVLNLLGAENTLKLQKQVVEKSRLGIPLLFAYDVIHGYKTIFPIPLAESCSWDVEVMKLSAKVAAKEAASAGLHWTFAPMVDVSRDARWGRVMEGAGEDSYLGTVAAKARVHGFQGDDLSSEFTIAACAKHFAGYGFVESGKDYNNVHIGQNTLSNVVLPPFKAAAEAGVATFMNAFNDIDGTPATANAFLLRDMLKSNWSYKGFVVSDWNSIGELIEHGVATDKKEAALLAIEAGSDMDMEGDAYIDHLEDLVKQGLVDEKTIDDAVRRVLQLKYDLGLFDDPYKYSDIEREKTNLLNPSHLEAARDVARKSIVLLKNNNNLLPINKQVKNIGIIGPLAKDKDSPLGNWRGQGESNSAVSLYEGLSTALEGIATLSYAEGCKLSIGSNTFHNELKINETDRSGFAKAIEVAKASEVVIMALGETAYMSGEGRSRSQIGLPGVQLDLLKAVFEVNKNVILVLMNGRPLTIPWEAENIPAIVEAWHLGSEAGNAIADVLTGDFNPCGKLTMCFPKNVGQLPIYYNHKATGRPSTGAGQVFYTHHTDVDNAPLFPFGYGLSYTSFEYGDIKLDKQELSPEDSLQLSVTITNTGKITGEEVVQLYIRDMVASITRPVKELIDFEKITIAPGESKTVSFGIRPEQLAFYHTDLSLSSESGAFKIFIGPNSQETKEVGFTLL